MRNFMDRMFLNTGKKIKTIAKISAWIIMITEIITGIATMTMGGDVLWILMCLGIIIASPVTAFLATVFIYGFGIIVDCAEKNLTNSDNNPNIVTKQTTTNFTQNDFPKEASPNTGETPSLGTNNPSDINNKSDITENNIRLPKERKNIREELFFILILIFVIAIIALPIMLLI